MRIRFDFAAVTKIRSRGRAARPPGWKARLAAVLSVLSLLAGACGSDTTGPGADLAGTYTLEAVGNSPLPAIVLELGDETVEILAGELIIRANGTFRSSITRRDTVAGSSSTEIQVDEGQWGRTGNDLTFFFSNGDRDAGIINGDTLTVISAGISFVFVRD